MLGLNPASNKTIIDFEKNKAFEFHKKLNGKAIRLPFSLKAQDHSFLSSLYAPQPIELGTARPPSHPVVAALVRIQRDRMNSIARHSGHNVLFFDSSLSPLTDNAAFIANGGNFHLCLNTEDPRYHQRLANALFDHHNQPGFVKDVVQAARLGINTELVCHRGLHHCNYTSPIAFAPNTISNIDLTTIAKLFYSHGIHVLHAFQIFPALGLVQNRHHYIDYQYTFEIDNDECLIGNVDDPSYGYRYNWTTFKSHFINSGIVTPFGFNILIEKTRNHGIMWELKYTRVNGTVDFPFRLPIIPDDTMRFPDICGVIQKGFYLSGDVVSKYSFSGFDFPPNFPFIVTSKRKCEQLYQFIVTRVEKSFDLETTAAYARSLLRRTIVGDHVIEEAWRIDTTELQHLIVSAYILAMTSRQVSNQRVSAAVRLLQSRSSIYSGVFNQIGTEILNLLGSTGARLFPGIPFSFVDRFTRYTEAISGRSNNIFFKLIENMQSFFDIDHQIHYSAAFDVPFIDKYLLPYPARKIVHGLFHHSRTLATTMMRRFRTLADTTIYHYRQFRLEATLRCIDIEEQWIGRLLQSYANIFPPNHPKVVGWRLRSQQWQQRRQVAQDLIARNRKLLISGPNKPLVNLRDPKTRLIDSPPVHPTVITVPLLDQHSKLLSASDKLAQAVDDRLTDISNNASEIFGSTCDPSFLPQYTHNCDHTIYHQVDVPGDGMCAFHTMAHFLGVNATELREQIRDSDIAPQQVVDLLSDPDAWGDYPCFAVCAQIYGVRFCIEFVDSRDKIFFLTPGNGPIYHVRLEHNHFSPLETDIDFPIEGSNVPGIFNLVSSASKPLPSFDYLDPLYRELKGQNTQLANSITARLNRLKTAKFAKGEIYLGPPGSCKTRACIKKLAGTGKRVLVSCPTRALAADWENKTSTEDFAVLTYQAALVHGFAEQFDTIVVDECFTIPYSYILAFAALARVRLILLGDPNQITSIDFSESKCHTGTPRLEDNLDCYDLYECAATSRIPEDIVETDLFQRTYPGISTTNHRKSLHIHDPTAPLPANHQVLCFTQEAKAQLCQFYPQVKTVHEAQGQTFDDVVLVVGSSPGELGLAYESYNHVIVACSRHTQNLVLSIDDVATFLQRTGLQPEPLVYVNDDVELHTRDNIDDTPRIVPADYVPFSPPAVESFADNPPSFIKDVDPSSVREVFDIYFPVREKQLEDCYYATTTSYNTEGSGRATVQFEKVAENSLQEMRTFTRSTFSIDPRGRYTTSRSRIQEVHTALQRLLKFTMNPPRAYVLEHSIRLVNQLNDLIPFCPVQTRNPELIHQAYVEYASKMTERGQGIEDITEKTIIDPGTVSLFLKQQFKQDYTSGEGALRDKSGQPISAWDKRTNFIFSVWARILEFYLLDSPTPRFKFFSRVSEPVLLKCLDSFPKDGISYFCNDFTEYDSCQNELEHEILAEVLRRIGAPAALIEHYLHIRRNRVAYSQTVKCKVKNKRDSGEPFTLIGNTIFTSCIVLDIMDDFDFLLVKGDDSAAGGYNISVRHEKIAHYFQTNRYVMKPNVSDSCEFVGYITNVNGTCLDIVRLCARLVGRKFKDEEDFNDYVISVRDRVRSFASVDLMHRSIAVISLHYKMAPEHVEWLYNYLLNFAYNKIPFDALMSSKQSIWNLISNIPTRF
ncbi:replicase [Hubei hepe-like virus 1]|uniref:replicase n=1 Tax=Hubei hepe-like virus 1 TaxID=1922894 RepID=UPI00090CC447|nr:replicase [Hubei hepe-like virus 1]APG77750.1 replicase [Hubei hepe-like virus 1]